MTISNFPIGGVPIENFDCLKFLPRAYYNLTNSRETLNTQLRPSALH